MYYVIPIAALLSVLVTYGLLARTSELTVLKACGVSLYRSALSVVVLSLGFSAVLFTLEQRVMAKANRRAEELDAQIKGRAPRTLNLLNRRWVVGADGVLYHYGLFDPQRNEMFGLTMFTLKPGGLGVGLADVRQTRGVSLQRLGRRTGMDARLFEDPRNVDPYREESPAWARAAGVFLEGTARRASS